MNYLGHVVSSDGIQIYPVKIETINNCPRPNNADELRLFVACQGYYCRFEDFFLQ